MSTRTIAGNFNEPQRCSAKRWIPFGSDNKAWYFTQDFMQVASKWKPLALNSTYNASGEVLSNYYLVTEGELSEAGNGMVRWQRTYAPIFADQIEYEGYAVQYPSANFSLKIPLRGYNRIDQFPTELKIKYFLVGVSVRDVTPKTLITEPDHIPLLAPVPIVNISGATTYDLNNSVHHEVQNPELVPDCVVNTTSANWGQLRTSGAGYSIVQEDYEAFILAGKKIVVQSSVLRRVFGNLYSRTTRYALAR